MSSKLYSDGTLMTAQILSAKPLVDKVKVDLKLHCDELKKRGVIPSMSVVLVGDNPASLSYIKNKKKLCEEVGAKFTLHQWPVSISHDEFLKNVQALNADKSIHGIIIQLPVTDSLKNLDLPNLVSPEKDIDGFHTKNTSQLYFGSKNLNALLPCTPKGIINLLKHYGYDLAGKNIVVVGRSLIVGRPLSMLLSNMDATVTLAHSKTKNINALTKEADIVVSAVGSPHFFNHESFSKSKNTVVIDVGMNTLNGTLVGDVDTEDVMEVVSAITPVPGGVGPMTVLSLIQNLITATENQIKAS